MNFIIAQILGIVMAVVSVVCVQFKNMRHILIGVIASNVLSALTYAFLGGLSGAGVCILAICQAVLVYVYGEKEKAFPALLNLGFIAGYIALSVISYKSIWDVLSAGAAVLYALAVVQKKASVYRILTMCNAIVWILYDVQTMAYTAIITHGILLIATWVAMIRLDYPHLLRRNGSGEEKAQ